MAAVSIVVPVFDAEDYILSTIAMVQAQTFEDWELILVEDSSRDDTKDILREFRDNTLDTRIKIMFIKNPGKGPVAARNAGVDAATGRYIAYLDADDVWRRNKLERTLEFIREKNAGFVFTAYEFGDTKAEPTGKRVHVPEKLNYRKALSRTVIFTSTVMFDTEKIDKELIKMPQVASEDTATWWNILRQGYEAHGLDEFLVIYRRPKESLSSDKRKAIARIWNLYRNVEKLPLAVSIWCWCGWAVRATLRRVL